MKTFIFFCVNLLYLSNFVFGATSLPGGPKQRTCVIGAGYSGLAAARYLKEYGIHFTVYEAAKDIGGTWRFDPMVGTNEFGVPVFTSQYKYLRTNTPRQTMEYNGFAFPKSTPSFPSGPCFYKYLKSFAKTYGLMKHIQVYSYVTSVKWISEGNHWNLTYTNSQERKNYTVRCHFVVAANGQYVKPVIPHFRGMDQFRGKILHSHDYKDPEDYRDKNVLLVGGGASALDLSPQLVNITKKLVHSHHLVYNEPAYPDSYVKKPDIKAFVSNGVVFEDGSFEEVDTAIFCTGFEFSQTFLDKSAGLTSSGKFLLPLHKSIVNIRHPSMTFIGVVKKVITRVLDAQAQYAALLIAGKFKLPSQEKMLKMWLMHVQELKKKNLKITAVNYILDVNKYFADLTEEAGVAKAAPVLSEMRDFNAGTRLDDVLNYRDYEYQVIDDYNYKRWYSPRNWTCDIQE